MGRGNQVFARAGGSRWAPAKTGWGDACPPALPASLGAWMDCQMAGALDGEQQRGQGGEGPKPLGGDRGSAGLHSLPSFPH